MTPTNVLIIDDSKVITRMTARALLTNKIEGHYFNREHIYFAYDGMQAFEMLGEHPNISLVISDVMMPELTGEELIEILVDTGRINTLEIIFMTTQINKNNICKQSIDNIKGVIYKPFNDVTFSQLFNKLDEEHKKKLEEIKKIKQNHLKQMKNIRSWIYDYCEVEKIAVDLKRVDPLIKLEFDHDHFVDTNELFMVFNSVLDSYIFEVDEKHEINHQRLKNIYNAWMEPEKYKALGMEHDLERLIESTKNSISEESSHEDIKLIFILPLNQLLSQTKKRVNVKEKLPYDDFIPYIGHMLDRFETVDSNYQSAEPKLILQHINEIQNVVKKLSSFSNKEELLEAYPDLDEESEHIAAMAEHMNMSIKYINQQIIPFYVFKANTIAWEKAKKSPKIVNYIKQHMQNRMLNTHNLLNESGRIDYKDLKKFKKYDKERVVVVSKHLETLELFKKTLPSMLPDLDVLVYTKVSILQSLLEKNNYKKVVVDLNFKDAIFSNGLQFIKTLRRKSKEIDNIIKNGELYIIVSQKQLDMLRNSKDKINYKIILKPLNKANVYDKFYLGS